MEIKQNNNEKNGFFEENAGFRIWVQFLLYNLVLVP